MDGKRIKDLKVAGIVSIRDELIRQQEEGALVCRTESGDPSFDHNIVIDQAIRQALRDHKTHYTKGAGINELRETISLKLNQANNILASPDEVLVTCGAMHALYVIFKSIVNCTLTDQRPVILVPTPAWTETFTILEELGVRIRYYEVFPDKTDQIDFNEFGKLIDSNTIGVVINSPHNPTGMVFKKKTTQHILDLCKMHNIYLVSDEAYENIVYRPNVHVSPDQIMHYSKTISIFSTSKSYSMSGSRVGYMAIKDKKLYVEACRLVRLTTNGVCSYAQWGANAAIRNIFIGSNEVHVLQEAYKNRRRVLYKALVKSSLVKPMLPGGAFYIWCKIENGMGSWELTEHLLKCGIGSAPGDVFGPGGKGHIRFSFSCSDGDIERAANKLREM